VAVLLAASVLIFLILHLTPGNPAAVLAGGDATPATVKEIGHQLGLDRPMPVQYWNWMSGLVRGDLGRSYIQNLPIAEIVQPRIDPTLELVAAAMILMTVVGLLLGILGSNPKGVVGRSAAYVVNTLSLSTPPFVSAVLLVLLLSIRWRVLPAGGAVSVFSHPVDGLKTLVMPAFAIALPNAAVVARIIQPSIRNVRNEEYTRTAVAKGIAPWQVMLRHVLPNALPPAIVILGVRLGQLLGGAVVVEAIFARPGIGGLLVQSVLAKDYLIVEDLLMVMVVVAIATQILTEIVSGVLDPRVRLGTT
jgi:peptide/nickel transport system permease protein